MVTFSVLSTTTGPNSQVNRGFSSHGDTFCLSWKAQSTPTSKSSSGSYFFGPRNCNTKQPPPSSTTRTSMSVENKINEDADSIGSVTGLIGRVKKQDSVAAHELWRRYFTQLHHVAKKNFGDSHSPEADEEDAASMAFHAMLDGFKSGRFAKINNRDEFWRMVVTITKRNVVKIQRRNKTLKRGGDKRKAGERPEELQDRKDRDSEALVDLSDTIRSVVAGLPNENCRQVFFLRIAGHNISEIVEETGLSERTVKRQLDTIRKFWKKKN